MATVTGLAVVATVLALLPEVGMEADDAVAEPAVAAAADAGVTATGYRPNVMSNEQMVEKLWTGADTVWVLICAMLVFFMNLGFGCIETGFARSKNCVNILSRRSRGSTSTSTETRPITAS